LVEKLLMLLLDGIALGCIYALIALGYTMVYGIIKLINFAHGEFYMVGAYVAFAVLASVGTMGLPGAWDTVAILVAATIVAALAAGVLAVAVERLAYRPLRRASRIAALLTALGVSLFLQNAAVKVFSPNTRPFPAGVVDRRYPSIELPQSELASGAVLSRDAYWSDAGGVEHFLSAVGQPLTSYDLEAARGQGAVSFHSYPEVTVRKKQIIIWVSALLLTLALHMVVRYTKMGKAMRAVSYDFEAAELMGINVNRVISFTFFVGAALAGAGAVLVGMYYGTIKPTMGVMYGLKAFVAAVIGGIGSIPGALFGGLALGTAESMVKLSPSTAPYEDAFAFAALVVMLVFLPNGFFGREEREKV